jgi:hypothetical protein
MKGLKRKMCGAAPCPAMPFFQAARGNAPADGAFFDAPNLQRQEHKEEEKKEEEKKDPVTEGLKTTGEQLSKHEPFKKWYEPKLEGLKYTLWDKASPADKAAMLTFLGLNLGTTATAFALNPQLRQSLSGVNIGKPLGWIPYSPVEGFQYTLPGKGKSSYGFSADMTLNPYLDAIRKEHPGMPLTGATFGLESAYDPAGKQLSLTGGKFGLDFFGGGLKAEGKTFKDLSPYPQMLPGQPGMPGGTLIQEVPGMPKIDRPGYQFTLNADLLKLFPGLQKKF